ncbi:YigZ family protein [Tessaracoccus sp. MC1865]|nr:YigZ family protein [Tessaracoccus sp. MC1865]MBB1484468.1 YigZ family protein [Tessaracoccus sp. MC1865]QTO38865.1 YigZ family protein [Tessaracoccus sp. MC1865]
MTIDAPPGHGVDVELEIKRSRFLTRLRRVTTEDEARAVIEERRSVHFSARHNCSAFVLGPDARTARSSDDGEPAGTAGIPMLQVLQKNSLTDVVAVVTRYFGGIKLGAGGLVRAYSDTVAQAVDAAGIRTVQLCRLLQIDVDFASAGGMEDQLRGLVLPSGEAVVVDGVEWSDKAHIRVAVSAGHEEELATALATMSAGALTATGIGERWVG